MSRDRTKGRRADSRAFRPTLEDRRLEPRLVLSTTGNLALSQFLLTHPQVGYAYKYNTPRFVQGNAALPFEFSRKYNKPIANVQTAGGGQSVNIATPDGSRFRVSLSLADNQYGSGLTAETGSNGTNVIPSAVVRPQGTIRAYPTAYGSVGLIVDGTTERMQLTIDPLPFAQRKGYAHSFAYGEASRTHVLNISSLNVTSGSIAGILGYHSADLTGPLSVGGTSTVDRIAFNALQPGASIGVGGTLNTLDVANNVVLTAGPGISVGSDLNLFNVGGSVTLANGASLKVGRFLGATPQPPKGSASGSNILSVNQALLGTGGATTIVPSLSAGIQGDFTIGPGSVLAAASGIANSSLNNRNQASPSIFLINGSLNIYSLASLQIPNLALGTSIISGNASANLIARNGINLAT